MKTSSEPLYRFITYHRIKPGQEDAFRRQLDRLLDNYNFVSPEEFERREGAVDTLNLLLTFDDGYDEWSGIVADALAQRNIKAVFFVCPDFVGLENNQAAQYCQNYIRVNPAPALSEEGLERLKSDGHTIGNHLIKHRDIRDESDKSIIRNTFKDSQQQFKQHFNITPNWLAYPFGDYFQKPDTVKAVANEFFNHAVTLIPGFNSSDSDDFYLQRDGFSPGFPQGLEHNWLKGGYDPVFKFTHSLGLQKGVT